MRRIIAYKGYFKRFYDSLDQKERDKIDRVLLLMQSEDRMPLHYIRPLREAIYELRFSVPNKELRILFIFDGEQLVILLNCFVKKTQKTPEKEIENALRLKKEYYESKKQSRVL